MFLGREAAERATKSREVDLSSFAFRAKNEEWGDRQPGQMTFGSYRFHSDQNNRMCVRFSCVERAN